MRTKRKFDLDKVLREVEEDEKLTAGRQKKSQTTQADIQEMIDRKRKEEQS